MLRCIKLFWQWDISFYQSTEAYTGPRQISMMEFVMKLLATFSLKALHFYPKYISKLCNLWN